MRVIASLGSFGVLLALASPVRAVEPRPFVRAQLIQEGERPAQCPSASELSAAANAMLGRDAVTARAGDVRVRYRVAHGEHGVSAELRLERGDGTLVGTRRVDSPEPDCSGLDERLALVLALMVDLPRDSAELALPPRARPWLQSYRVASGALLGVGWLESPRWGLFLDQWLKLGPLPRLGLGLSYWPKHDLERAQETFEVEAWQVGLLACPRLLDHDPWLVELCARTTAGRLLAVSTSLPYRQAARLTTFDVSGGVLLGARLVGPLRLLLGGESALSVVRGRGVFLDEAGTEREAFITPLLHGTVSAALALEFSR